MGILCGKQQKLVNYESNRSAKFSRFVLKSGPEPLNVCIGIPPRTDVGKSDMADVCDLMDEWVERGAEKK